VYRYDLGVAGVLDLIDRLHWGNTFFFAANDYDFSGGAPWNTILTMRLGTRLSYDITEHWGASVGGVFSFAPEAGADWGDSFTGAGMIAGQYRHSPRRCSLAWGSG
jgi:hypothetical protein